MMRLTGDSYRWVLRAWLWAICTCTVAFELHASEDEGAAPKATDLRIAADRFDQGRDAFKVGAFGEAAEHFEAADARAPSLSALTLAMRSRAEARQFAKAASLAELLISRQVDNVEALGQARSLIEAHARNFGRLDIGCEPRCELVIDRKLVHGSAQTNWRVYVEPGAHDVTANFEGDRLAEGQVTVESGQSAPLALAPPRRVAVIKANPAKTAAAPQPDTPAPTRRGWSPTWFWLGVSATAAVGAVTIWSGIDALTNPGPGEVQDQCAGQGTSCELYQEGQAKELRTNVLLGGTIVLALATAATGFFATDFSGGSPAQGRGRAKLNVRITANLGMGNSALLGAEGRF